MKLSKQQQKVLDILKAHPKGISTERLKREYGLTEVNGRISELRNYGFEIERVGFDEHGFGIQRLKTVPKTLKTTYEPVMKDGRQVAVRAVQSWV